METSVRTDLNVDGMTCAACASRIQRRLTKLDSVGEAQVNFANGRATVVHNGSVDESTLVEEVEALGYSVIDADAGGAAEDAREEDLRRRLILAVLLACLLYTSPSPRDATLSRMPSSA